MTTKTKPRLATAWLDGCSGCHMSVLDLDERLLDVLAQVELVYSPIMDIKEFPENVDVAIVEGAVSSDEDEHKIQTIRQRSKLLISLGDCAVTGNVPSMRNAFEVGDLLARAYDENASAPKPDANGHRRPTTGIPTLRPMAQPIHEVVSVDLYVPGCPPPADAIFFVLTELLQGRTPDPSQLTRFGQ